MRLFEASHTPEILKKAGPNGLHVKAIAEENGVDATKLAHILRLLCTHHFVREVTPNVFANNRLSSMIDSGKSIEELRESPEIKYENSNGIAAFVGLCTDELHKASAFLTEAYLLSPKAHLNGKEPTRAPFNYAFGCEGVDFFGWLEGEGIQGKHVNGRARSESIKLPGMFSRPSHGTSDHQRSNAMGTSDVPAGTQYTGGQAENPNQFRLERFGIAMAGTDSWEVPGAALNAFDWELLPRGSLIVDVGGGIGSTMMLLAHAFSRPGDEDAMNFKFIIQDRQVVVDMGEKAWRAKCPEYLDLEIAEFKVHDFFTPQPIKDPAVFFLRVVLHDWPTDYARLILLRLRDAASPRTKLLIADFIIPLACTDDFGSRSTEDGDGIEGIMGAENLLAPAPLLPNLGKASANVYWMDLTMQVTFNGQERTLREIVALARSAGWKVTRVVKAHGSHFGHITAIPTDIPLQNRVSSSLPSDGRKVSSQTSGTLNIPREILTRSMSRCCTPTFGSGRVLPSLEDATVKNRFGFVYTKVSGKRNPNVETLKPAPNVATARKPRPSPLSIPNSPPSAPLRINTSSLSQTQSVIRRRPSHAHMAQLYSQSHQGSISLAPGISSRHPPPSPLSPRLPVSPLSRRSSLANLSLGAASQNPPSLIPIRQLNETSNPTAPPPPSPTVSRHKLTHRQSFAQLTPARKRSESIVNHSPKPELSSLARTFHHLGDAVQRETRTYATRVLDFTDTLRKDEATQLEEDSRKAGCSLLAAAVQIEKGSVARRGDSY
ncbi:hypothetical protein E1B28_005867 [Marasmius oreades]|nr:uncharacterized protein E1B28_005867 [Marasmius oreades]KAG7095079.1 hypothetical protein E1B28_005867 [Marasmius oreades]